MGINRSIIRLAAGLGLSFLAGAASAQWELDNDSSSLNFISVKNDAVAESHSFDTLLGYIGEDGAVQLSVDLDSVNTLIDIRNERMREVLFETADFPSASVNGTLDPAILEALEPGSVVTTDIELTLSLHGQEAAVTAPVVVMNEPGNGLRVISSRPVFVSAADFNLVKGIAALQEIASLDSIDTVVPVTFHLVFNPAAQGQ